MIIISNITSLYSIESSSIIRHRSIDIHRNVVTYARKQKKQVGGGGGFGKSTSTQQQQQIDEDQSIPSSSPPPDLADNQQLYNPPTISNTTTTVKLPSNNNNVDALPSISRDQIISTCIISSAIIAVAGLGIHELAPIISTAVKDGHQDEVLSLLAWNQYTLLPSLQDTALAIGAATAITLARYTLLSTLPSFKQATDASNNQVLAPLSSNPLDILIVALLPAISEEFLFRGALIPAIYPDWRGVVIAGSVFGALHVNGGRNVAFAVWASVVGCVYGGLFLMTGNVVVPIVAHGLGNVASAALWIVTSSSRGEREGERSD